MMLYAPISTDEYPVYGLKYNLQIRSVISIVDQKFNLDIVQNTFNQNSGTRGIIFIDARDRGDSYRVLIADNVFSLSYGYIGASSLFIRARGP